MAAKPDIWMPLYIGDYISATTHLSAEESGAYLHLLMHQWKNGELPSDMDSLRRVARVDKDAWSIVWASLKHFFSMAGEFPVQLRLEEIRDDWQAKKSAAVKKAEEAAAKRWKNHPKNAPSIPPSNAQAMPRSCPSSSSSPAVSTKVDTHVAQTSPSESKPDRGKVRGVFPCVGSGPKEFTVHEQDVVQWVDAYPGIDVEQNLRAAKSWLTANPKRQKTHSGMARFLNSWLSKEQDKARPQIASQPVKTVEQELPEHVRAYMEAKNGGPLL